MTVNQLFLTTGKFRLYQQGFMTLYFGYLLDSEASWGALWLDIQSVLLTLFSFYGLVCL